MKTIDRRELLKGAGSLAAFAAWPATALGARATAAATAPGESTGTAIAPGRSTTPARLRLASNENPYGPGPRARAALLASLDESSRYAFETLGALAREIAAREGVTPDHVVLGAGSGEVLQMAALAYGRTEVVSAQPTFRQLHAFAGRLGAKLVEVPVDAELRHDLDAMRARIGPSTGIVYVVNPNNPTGTAVPGPALRAFLRTIAEPTIAVVDEAYLELAAPGATESMVDLVRDGRNVVVCRTFSKVHGLAGLRVGYGLARPDVAKQLREWRQTIPSTPGVAAARASLEDTAFLADCTRKLRADRARIERACDARGWRYTASEGNFVFVDVQRPLAEFATAMDARGIAVGRLFDGWPTWCRLTVGTTDETTRLIEVLRDV